MPISDIPSGDDPLFSESTFYIARTGAYSGHSEAGSAYVGTSSFVTGLYTEGDQVTFTAYPAATYFFHNWVDANGSAVASSNPYVFTMPAYSVAYYATFGHEEVNPGNSSTSISTATVKVKTSNSWKTATVKRYTGSAWVPATVKVFKGSGESN